MPEAERDRAGREQRDDAGGDPRAPRPDERGGDREQRPRASPAPRRGRSRAASSSTRAAARRARRRAAPYPCAASTSAAPSRSARSSPSRSTATATPAACRRSSSGSGFGAAPAKLDGSTKTSETLPLRERALDQPLDEARRQRRRHDRQLERPRDRARLVGEHRGQRRAGLGLDGGEQVERLPPVALGRADALLLGVRAVDDQHRPPPAPDVREQERARRAHLHVEALADDRLRVGVEHDRDLVARRVLELLDHQLRAPRGRAPVHLAQRVAVLVVAHAVQVEARRPPQQQPPPVVRAGAALREEPVELDQARVDEQRAGRLERLLDPLEAERVLDHRDRALELVAAARQPLEHVAGVPGRADRRGELAELPDPLAQRPARGHEPALRGEPDRRPRRRRPRAARPRPASAGSAAAGSRAPSTATRAAPPPAARSRPGRGSSSRTPRRPR